MLGGTEVVRGVGAFGAGPVAGGGVWVGADAGSAAKAGGGHLCLAKARGVGMVGVCGEGGAQVVGSRARG